MIRALAAAVLLASSAHAGPRPATHRPTRKAPKPSPVKKSAATAKAAPRAESAAAAPAAAPESLDEIALFGLGAALVPKDGGLSVAAVLPGSRAERAGLKPGDALLRVNGAVATVPEASAALRAWTPGTRLSLVARRGLEIRSFETEFVPAGADYKRGDHDLSAHESALAAERAARATSDGRAVVKAVGPLTVPVRADQGLWARFPKGLPAGLKKGDEVTAEAATGLTTDGSLDFLAVAPGSKLRARVVEAADDGETRSARLAFYALDLAGGGTYPAIGAAVSVSGDQRVARVTSGGTLVAAAPLPDAKSRAPEPVLDADARVRVRLLDPLVVDEAPSYWRAGPGLWVKTVEDSGKRLFEVTHAIEGRSADAAGLKTGDRLDSIGGRSTEKMDFSEAIDRLYGAPGSEVEVSVVRKAKSETLKLKRGVQWSAGKPSSLPLPIASR